MEASIYFGGLPTDFEIKKLQETYPPTGMKKGQVILYEEIEDLLSLARQNGRFRTVTNRWRKKVEDEHGIILAPQRAEGFRVCDEGEKLGLATNKLKTAGRMARRSYKIAGRVAVGELSIDQRQVYDHLVKRSAAVLQASKLRPSAALPEV